MKKKYSKQALKNTVTKTKRKQIGDGRRWRKTLMNRSQRKRSVVARKRKTTIRRQSRPARNRVEFFSKSKMIDIFLPNEMTHSSLDCLKSNLFYLLFKMLLIQKIGCVYSSIGTVLKFEITGDRNNIVDQRILYLEIRYKVTQKKLEPI